MITDPTMIQKRLTEREFAYWRASREGLDLSDFAGDTELLELSIQAKLNEAVEMASKQEFENRPDSKPIEQHDIFDKLPKAAPYARDALLPGDRIMYKPSGSIHRVSGVNHETGEIHFNLNGRHIYAARELVAKIMQDRKSLKPQELEKLRSKQGIARGRHWGSDGDS